MSAEHEDMARRYQWYTNYDRSDEYDKSPEWALDMRADVEENEDGSTTTKFYNKFDPEHIWIKSDTVYDLTNTL